MTLIESLPIDQFINDNSIYFAIFQEDRSHFKRWSNDGIEDISKHSYSVAKYGFYTETDTFSERVRMDSGHLVVSNYKIASLKILDKNGSIVKDLSPLYSMLSIESIYSLDIDSNGFLWMVSPTDHYVGKINLETMSEEFCWRPDLHSDNSEFNYPQYVSYSNDYLFVSDMGNMRIAVVDPDALNVAIWKTVGKPVFYMDFLECGYSVYKFDDGLYVDSSSVGQFSHSNKNEKKTI